jgi:dGTPase
MHVATISATICKALDLDVDLAWAISLGHDLGHTPFGHAGEKVLDSLISDRGGFNHELFSLRVVDHIINYGKGLNLTYAVRDGIVNHCGEQFESTLRPDFHYKDLDSITDLGNFPCTWEGTVMRMSDKVAYLGRDVEDAIQLRLIKKSDLPAESVKVLGDSNSDIIDTMVNDIIKTSLATGAIGFSDEVYHALVVLKDFNYERIYLNPILSDYHTYFYRIMKTLFEYLGELFGKFGLDFDRYAADKNQLAVRFGDYLSKMSDFYGEVEKSWDRSIVDYLAGMTDDFALECVNDVMIPKRFDTPFDAPR